MYMSGPINKLDDTSNLYNKAGVMPYARIFASDRLTQGVDVEVVWQGDSKAFAGVYLMLDETTGEIVKIGETRNIYSKFNTQYKCIRNSTNDRIREYVREIGSVKVYAVEAPTMDIDYFGHKIKLTCCRAIERIMLSDYIASHGEYPVLNKYNR